MKVEYKNHRGDIRIRDINIKAIRFGEDSIWHDPDQWLLHAWDTEKKVNRTFALKDCNFRIEENDK